MLLLLYRLISLHMMRTTCSMTPAIGQMIQVMCQLMVKKLQIRYRHTMVGQYTDITFRSNSLCGSSSSFSCILSPAPGLIASSTSYPLFRFAPIMKNITPIATKTRTNAPEISPRNTESYKKVPMTADGITLTMQQTTPSVM